MYTHKLVICAQIGRMFAHKSDVRAHINRMYTGMRVGRTRALIRHTCVQIRRTRSRKADVRAHPKQMYAHTQSRRARAPKADVRAHPKQTCACTQITLFGCTHARNRRNVRMKIGHTRSCKSDEHAHSKWTYTGT